MNLKKIICGVVGICILLFVTAKPIEAATTAAINKWYLVDSGKHLDYDGNTKYMTQFELAVKTWNTYKSGVIRVDNASRIQDVKISDYYEVGNVAGVTNAKGTIKFNTYNMDDYSSTKKRNVCTHELGHALGLAHNFSTDVMYFQVSTKIYLSDNDKASYDKSYKRY